MLIEFHHINPVSVSKDNSLDNCVALCEDCHRTDAHVEGNTKGYVLEEDEYIYLYGRKKPRKPQKKPKCLEQIPIKQALNKAFKMQHQIKASAFCLTSKPFSNPYSPVATI
ncbi:MAG: HNH endonuclease [Rhodothermia bacterium]|nr:HNH endonuclease [Rhodothermia bacterium]